jgi:hypothetical protein
MHALITNLNQERYRKITKGLPTSDGVMAGLLSLVTILHQAGEESYSASKDGVSKCKSAEACPQCSTTGQPTRENYPQHKCTRYVSCQIGVHSGSIHVSRALFNKNPHSHDTTMLELPLHCDAASSRLSDGLRGGHGGEGEDVAAGGGHGLMEEGEGGKNVEVGKMYMPV